MYINYVHSGMEGRFRIIYWAMLNVRGQEADESEFGVIITRCRRILQSNPGFVVDFVRRNRNVVAHELAQRSFSLASPFIGHVTPLWLEDALSCMCTDIDH